MNLNNISLPYPVLGISDDICPMLPDDAVQFELSDDVRNFFFDIRLNFDNDDIQRLIDEGKAEFSCEYDCARTMMRHCQAKNTVLHNPIGLTSLGGEHRDTITCIRT